MPEGAALAAELKARGRALGFDEVRVAPPGPSRRAADGYRAWLDAGHAGEMHYMARSDRVARTLAPALTLPAAKSIVVVAASYFAGDLPGDVLADPSRGIIASYAWRDDYHDTMTPRLKELSAWLAEAGGARTTPYVDTGPILERDAAERAGLGFVGRNTMLIHPQMGSWLFLGVILVDAVLPPDPEAPGTCGRCTRCLTACPTEAFPEAYVLDARRCISYLTIELKGPIPPHLRAGMGNRIFGCDICNEVCPYNVQTARRAAPPPVSLDVAAPLLLDLAALSDGAFTSRFGHTPVARPKRRGFLRNVAVALGNWGAPEALDGLAGMLGDAEPLVRSHAAWAAGRVSKEAYRGRAGNPAAGRLAAAARNEQDPDVLAEIEAALRGPVDGAG